MSKTAFLAKIFPKITTTVPGWALVHLVDLQKQLGGGRGRAQDLRHGSVSTFDNSLAVRNFVNFCGNNSEISEKMEW
jgi:hypothetical protein